LGTTTAGTDTADAATPAATPANTAEPLNRIALPDFNPDTWKATAETPLPPMESPITFRLKDMPSYWYDTELTQAEDVLHTRSLGVGVGPTTIKFLVEEPHTSVQHTVTSLIWPTGAQNMPFGQPGGFSGERSVELVDPGLYAFYCVIHPYMLGAVVIDDPSTPGADIGKSLHWLDGTDMPSNADELIRTVRSFFVITEPANWQTYATNDTEWDPSYPAAPVLLHNADGSPELIPNLDQYYAEKYSEPMALKAPSPPAGKGVGTVFVDTQWEGSKGNDKYGSITYIDAENWKMTRKVFNDFNHPHNYWSSLDGEHLYSTNWFGDKLTVMEEKTGKVITETVVGPSPSHVLTRANNDHVIVALNGGGAVVELDPAQEWKVVKRYPTQGRGENPGMPHGFGVTGDGKYVVTPNANETTSAIINMETGELRKVQVGKGLGQVATWVTNDGKRAYTANLWSHELVCFSVVEGTKACPTPTGGMEETYPIDLRANYDKITGKSTGPFGLVPIQTPASPDDQVMLTVGTVTGNILVTDLDTNKVVKELPCGPGCHGINFGAKQGGGYYAYVTVKFANKMIVVDADPNMDGDPSDAMIAGSLLTDPQEGIEMDGEPDEFLGQGGNGVEIYPIVYNGWVQKLPDAQKAKLTCRQRDPLSTAPC
jgi:DNA-binding beta-propeller fold protein YncE